MSLITYHQNRDSIAAFTQKVVHQIEDILTSDNKWWATLMDYLDMSDRLEQLSAVSKFTILYVLRENWDDLPLEFRKTYNMDFYVLANKFTDLSTGTLDNYLRAVEVFVWGKFQPFGTIKVLKRDSNREIVYDKEGSPVMEEVEWDVNRIPISKLVLTTPHARNGMLERDPKLLSLLMDEGATTMQVRTHLYTSGSGDSGNTPPSDPNPEIRFAIEGPFLTATQFGNTVPIAELDIAGYETDEQIRDSINRMALMLGVVWDEDWIRKHNERKELEHAYNHAGRAG